MDNQSPDHEGPQTAAGPVCRPQGEPWIRDCSSTAEHQVSARCDRLPARVPDNRLPLDPQGICVQDSPVSPKINPAPSGAHPPHPCPGFLKRSVHCPSAQHIIVLLLIESILIPILRFPTIASGLYFLPGAGYHALVLRHFNGIDLHWNHSVFYHGIFTAAMYDTSLICALLLDDHSPRITK